MNKSFVSVLLALGLISGCAETPQKNAGDSGPRFTETINAQSFYKGNIHTHSNASDGNVSPERVTSWYEKHGYNFLALTEHDKLVRERSHEGPEFITLPGVELTGQGAAEGRPKIPVHVNAICGHSTLAGVRAGKPIAETANAMIKAAHDDGAVTLVNHPNFEWAFGASELLGMDGFELLEIASGHHLVHDLGDENHPSEEELWDTYLTQKHRIFASGSDDAHNYTRMSETDEANPGRVWLQLWAPALDERSVCDALRWGHFYVSRGPRISALVVSRRTFDIQVSGWHPASDHVDFIGAGGRRLAQVFEMPARYELRGGEGYVRAHVFQGSTDSDGKRVAPREAWTQAYFIKE